MNELKIILTVAFSFIIGSIPCGYIIGKIKGVDLRNKGSRNIGASNAFRVLGKTEGILTLLFDMLKGFVPAILTWVIFKNLILVEITALFAVLGHDFSIFLKFKGGKGVATTYGASIFFSLYSLIGLIIWLVILKTTKYASLASLLPFFVVTLIIIFTKKSLIVFFAALFILMLVKHYPNINRLLKGVEHKINEKTE